VLAREYPDGLTGISLNASMTIACCDPTLSSVLLRTLGLRNVYRVVGIPPTSDCWVLASEYPPGVTGVPLNCSIVMDS